MRSLPLADDCGESSSYFQIMQLACPVHRRRRRSYHRDEVAQSGQRVNGGRSGLPLYLSGAGKSFARNFGSVNGKLDRQAPTGQLENDLEEEQELRGVDGEGVTTHTVAYGLALRGRTDATFSNNFSTEN